jgi:type IV secretion system protein VirD4
MPTSLWSKNDGIYFGFGVEPTKAESGRSILEEQWVPARDKMNRYPSSADPNNSGDRHVVTVGPNGSGKTRRLLVPNLYRLKDWSIVVIDIKGELAALTAAYRAAQPGHKVVVIDPFAVIPKTYPRLVEKYPYLASNGFNPVEALDPDSEDFADEAMALAEAIIRIEGQEPHWGQSAQDLIAALIMSVRLSGLQSRSFADVRLLLGQRAEDFREAMREMSNSGFPELAVKAGRFADFSGENRELNSIVSTALTQTRWLDSRPIKADLAKGSFDYASLKQSPTTVYLVLPPRYLATHSTWLRLMLTSILLPLLRSVENAKVPVLFMLDEFAQLGPMPVIENNLALMRGYGLKLWPVFQDLAQAKALYKERWESFIGNAGVVQSFAPQDVTTREYLSKMSGERLYWLKTGGVSASTSLGGHATQSSGMTESAQHMPGPVFWPQGLGNMALGQAVLFSRGRAVRTWLPDPEDQTDTLGLRKLMEQARRDYAN